MILEGYKNVLSNKSFQNIDLKFETSNNCDYAYDKLNSNDFDIIFLDLNFPVDNENQTLSGEELAMLVKKKFPKVSLAILTELEDNFRLQSILSNLNPDALLLKGETNSKEIIRCIKHLIVFQSYYSATILGLLRRGINQGISLDRIDRIILYQLSLGTKTKNIPKHVTLSLRAVEDRKRKLKELFGVIGESNKSLLDKAKEGGYI